MYILISLDECDAYQGVFSSPDKAKEAIENYYNHIEVGGNLTETTYEYEDRANGCFKVVINGWGMGELELIFPEMDKYIYQLGN